MPNYIFYDTETSGTDTRFDQVFQYCAMRTDDRFRRIEHLNVRARRLPYIIPRPQALLVTHIDPHTLDDHPLSYHEMACLIHRTLESWTPAVFVGFNSTRFDEPIVRSMFWQNLLNPYLTNTAHSKRLDLLAVIHTALAIRPDVLVIPKHPVSGKKSMKLEHLAPANGYAGHNAHDALGDVEATAYLAGLIRARMPLLWEAMLANADPLAAGAAARCEESVLVSSCFGRTTVHLTTFVASAPSNPKRMILFDLAHDPKPLLNLSPTKLAAKLRRGCPALRKVTTNTAPAVFRTGHPAIAGLQPTKPSDPQTRLARFKQITAHPTIRANVAAALDLLHEDLEPAEHLEERIYDGMTSHADAQRLKAFHAARDWNEKSALIATLEDQRPRALGERIVHLHTPEILAPAVRDAIDAGYAKDRLLAGADAPWTSVHSALKDLDDMEAQGAYDQRALAGIRGWLEGVRLQAELIAEGNARAAAHRHRASATATPVDAEVILAAEAVAV